MTNESKIEKFIDSFWNYVDSLSNLDAVEYESEKQFRKDMAEELSQLLTPSQVDVEAVKEEYESIFVRKEVKRVDTSNSIELPLWKDNHSHLSVDIWNFFAPYLTPKTDSREIVKGFVDYIDDKTISKRHGFVNEITGEKTMLQVVDIKDIKKYLIEYLKSKEDK